MAFNGSAPTELGTMRISTLLKKYAVPGIIAMTASSLYNMVDSIFIGHMSGTGSLAISGLAVTFPLMNLSAAMGTLVGVGASTLISVLLGQKNLENAGKVLSNVVSLNTILGTLFALVTLLFLDPILRFFGASDATLPFAHSYIVVILLGNVVTHLYFGLNGIIRASGHPKTAMGLTIFTVTANAVLDPIFIYVLKLGIQGAALATVLCQTLALTYTMRFFLNKNNYLHFGHRVFRLDWNIAQSSLAIGLGPFLMNAAACLVTLFINQQLRKYGGDLALGAYGIVNRFSFLFIMINMGLNQGMQPIAGYNFGARLYSRVRQVLVQTATWATAVTVLGCLISEVFPQLAVGMFTSDPELKRLAIRGLRITNAAFPAVGLGMVATHFFQSLGMVRKSIFLSLSRQLIFLLPLLYTLPLVWQERGVWVSFPISDAVAFFASLLMLVAFFRKFGRLRDGDDPSALGSAIR